MEIVYLAAAIVLLSYGDILIMSTECEASRPLDSR